MVKNIRCSFSLFNLLDLTIILLSAEAMISAGSSEANTSYNRKLAQQLRSGKPESVVDAYREVRVPRKG